MYLCELMYYSKANDDITEQDLDSILEIAQPTNKKRCITGALLLYKGFFVQCIEGERDILNSLYSSIIHDARHNDVRLVRFRTIEERVFRQWSMGKANANSINDDISLQYAPNLNFNPSQMSPEQLYRLLIKLLAS